MTISDCRRQLDSTFDALRALEAGEGEMTAQRRRYRIPEARESIAELRRELRYLGAE